MVGVSGDDIESHKKFKSELDIPFQLLADEGNEVSIMLRLQPSRTHDLLQAPGCTVLAIKAESFAIHGKAQQYTIT